MNTNINRIIRNIYQGKNKFVLIIVDEDPLSVTLGNFVFMRVKQNLNVPTYIIDKDAALNIVETYNIKEYPTTLYFNHQHITNKICGFKTLYSY